MGAAAVEELGCTQSTEPATRYSVGEATDASILNSVGQGLLGGLDRFLEAVACS